MSVERERPGALDLRARIVLAYDAANGEPLLPALRAKQALRELIEGARAFAFGPEPPELCAECLGPANMLDGRGRPWCRLCAEAKAD
jgi:hypothetical protein